FWYSKTLTNLEIHAFNQSRVYNYTDPIRVRNDFHGANLELRMVSDEDVAYVIGWTNHRSVFSGGGLSETGYNQNFSYKVRLNYLMLGVEFAPDPQIAIGISVDFCRWKIFYKSDSEFETMEDYELLYGKSSG